MNEDHPLLVGLRDYNTHAVELIGKVDQLMPTLAGLLDQFQQLRVRLDSATGYGSPAYLRDCLAFSRLGREMAPCFAQVGLALRRFADASEPVMTALTIDFPTDTETTESAP